MWFIYKPFDMIQMQQKKIMKLFHNLPKLFIFDNTMSYRRIIEILALNDRQLNI